VPLPCSVQLPRPQADDLAVVEAHVGAVVAEVGELEAAAVPVDPRRASATRASRRRRRWPAGCGPAPPASAGCRTRGAGRPGQAQAVGLADDGDVTELRDGGVAAAASRARAPARARRGRAAPAVEAAKARACSFQRQAVQHSTVTRVSLSPAWSISRAATLTASPKQSPAISTTSPRASPPAGAARAGRTRRRVRCPCATMPRAPRASAIALHRGRDRNTAIRPSPRVLTTCPAAVRSTALRQRVDAVRHDRGGLGVAQRFEQRRAAAQVGEQDGAVGDRVMPGASVA
jgi:hypothetical protein